MLLFSTFQKRSGMFMMLLGKSKENRELIVRLWLGIFLFVKQWGLFREVLAQNLRSLQMFTIALKASFPFASRSMPAMCLQVWGFLWHDLHKFSVVLSLSNTCTCMLLLREWTKACYCFSLNQFSSVSEQAAILFQICYQVQVLALASVRCFLMFRLFSISVLDGKSEWFGPLYCFHLKVLSCIILNWTWFVPR